MYNTDNDAESKKDEIADNDDDEVKEDDYYFFHSSSNNQVGFGFLVDLMIWWWCRYKNSYNH